MFLIIAGSRECKDRSIVERTITEFNLTPELIIHGAARGVDSLAHEYALKHKIPVIPKPANWDLYGKKAGRIRNNWMAFRGDALLAIWDGKSPGTLNMITQAAYRQIPIYVKIIDI